MKHLQPKTWPILGIQDIVVKMGKMKKTYKMLGYPKMGHFAMQLRCKFLVGWGKSARCCGWWLVGYKMLIGKGNALIVGMKPALSWSVH